VDEIIHQTLAVQVAKRNTTQDEDHNEALYTPNMKNNM
jgi:hypothetical protein